MELPSTFSWDDKFINILLLYCFIFDETYIYNFQFDGTEHIYLLGKNKNKMQIGTLYRKLIFMLEKNIDLSYYNFFSKEIFSHPKVSKWLNDIYKFISSNEKIITFNDVFKSIENVFQINNVRL